MDSFLKMLASQSLSALSALAIPAMLVSSADATEVFAIKDKNSANAVFCKANLKSEAIIILPSSVLRSLSAISCQDGNFIVRKRNDSSDPGHSLVSIDPPKGKSNVLDCNAKYDLGLTSVALNCLRFNAVDKRHSK